MNASPFLSLLPCAHAIDAPPHAHASAAASAAAASVASSAFAAALPLDHVPHSSMIVVLAMVLFMHLPAPLLRFDI